MSLSPMLLLALALSYVAGSLPSGLWMGLWLRGVDIRKEGSKNIGATNTMRVLGKPLGATALFFDIVKGLVPVVFFARLSPEDIHLPMACGVAAVLGHTFSLFIRFKGGKGVATSTGVFLGLATWPALIAIGLFAVVVAITRMVSAGSILGALSLAITVWLFPLPLIVQVMGVLIAALVVIKHRSNLKRILQGDENRI
ncbi:MAG: glycerol-3-phosphate 1-O-acyltransferase PlsY [Candidatus Hydrogenedentes bacterium]|nr:glycerol-3-phosphate 1-O-acyltransferase PlsY [Candidatus Hydrogenedentota bacterium]